ncbi:MAG TPA: fibronectin type III domain-containing protein, partial [Candidatus Limnocylindrales bacterium]|nr:fibronectin type III domain-containing protein [Candidatus Limnocylindrales bacterium]
LASDQSDPFSNVVTASSLRDPNPANDDASVDTIIGDAGADLAVTKRGPAVAEPGADLTYTIELTNLGPDPAVNARIADPVPSKTTYVSVNGPVGWTCTGPNLSEGNSAVCVTPELASGASATFTVVVRAASSATGTISNTAFATAETPDPSPWTNNTATTVATVGTPPAGVPGAPGTLTATAGNGQVALAWAAPAFDGGSPLTGYDVYLGTTSHGQSGTPVNAAPLSTGATSFTVPGLANGTPYYFTVKAINAVGHSVASNEATATPFSATSVVYNGALVLTLGSPFAPGALLSSGSPQCVAGQNVTFSLDANPFTGASGAYLLGTASTTTAGQATGGPFATNGWQEGVYTVTASFTGTAGAASACTPSFDTAIVTVAASGSTAFGAGWYTLGGSGRVGFGFTIRAESGGGHTGRLQLVNNGKWRLKGSLSVYAKARNGQAAASGTGDLYWWNAALASGLGDWELARSGVPFTINFTASGSKKAAPGTFGITIDHTPVPPQPDVLPSSTPQAVRGGRIDAT